jgi:hypothetical protein
MPVINLVSSFEERLEEMGERDPDTITFRTNRVTPGFPNDPFVTLLVPDRSRTRVVLFAMDQSSGTGTWLYKQLNPTDAPNAIIAWASLSYVRSSGVHTRESWADESTPDVHSGHTGRGFHHLVRHEPPTHSTQSEVLNTRVAYRKQE